MKIKIILGMFLVILLASFVSATITPDKNIIDLEWEIGEAQHSPVTVTFTSTGEVIDLAISDYGETASMLDASPTTLSFTNTSLVKSTTVSFNLPDTPGIFHGNLKYGPDNIPIYIIISQPEEEQANTECKLKPITATNYITTIKQGASSFTQRFMFRVSNKCEGIVHISDVIPMDTIQTDEGRKPVRLTGSMNLGDKDPGDEVAVNVLFDVDGLEPGVYSPILKIVGTYEDDPISAEINFEITVTTSAQPIDQITNTDMPIYIIPDSITAGESFSVKVTNLNPNFQPEFIYFDLELFGETTIKNENEWTWIGHVNETGELEIQMVTMYLGGPIGAVQRKIINVGGDTTVQSSNVLKFEFYPTIENLKEGDVLNILTRDNSSNNIVNSEIYLNGIKQEGTTITVASGMSYCISAVASSYNTADTCFEVKEKQLKIFVVPDPAVEGVWVGSLVSIVVKDPVTSTDLDGVILKMNSEQVSGTFTATEEGEFLVEASKEGYIPANFTFSIKELIEIIYFPEEGLEKGKEAEFRLNKNVSWSVIYYEDKESLTEELIISGVSSGILFVPEKNGIYSLVVDGSTLYSHELEGFGFSLPDWMKSWKFVMVMVLVVVIIGFIFFNPFKKKGGGVGFGVPSELSEPISEEI